MFKLVISLLLLTHFLCVMTEKASDKRLPSGEAPQQKDLGGPGVGKVDQDGQGVNPGDKDQPQDQYQDQPGDQPREGPKPGDSRAGGKDESKPDDKDLKPNESADDYKGKNENDQAKNENGPDYKNEANSPDQDQNNGEPKDNKDMKAGEDENKDGLKSKVDHNENYQDEKVVDGEKNKFKNEIPDKSGDKKQFPDFPEDNYSEKEAKPVGGQPDLDLGAEHKKVIIKQKDSANDDKNVNFDEKETGFGDKDSGYGQQEPGLGDKGVGAEEGNGKPFDSGYGSGKDGNDAGNTLFDKLLQQIKANYRKDLDKVQLTDVKPFDHGRWGSVKLHSGFVTGLLNFERISPVQVIPESDTKKLLVGDLVVNDVEADYKADAKLFHRLSISDREIKLSLKKAIITAKLEVDKELKKVSVREIHLKHTEGFGVKTAKLFWPFNKLTNAIVKSQEPLVKAIVKKELALYMDKVVHDINFDDISSQF